jgi:hypothetical protein
LCANEVYFARRKATTTLVRPQYQKGAVNYYGSHYLFPAPHHTNLIVSISATNTTKNPYKTPKK